MLISFVSLTLFLFCHHAFGLQAPATAGPTPRPKTRVQIRDSPPSTVCNMSPSRGLLPFCLHKFTSMSLRAPKPPSATSTSSPVTVSCKQRNEDPDQGVEDQGCICSSGTVTTTLPILATGVVPSSSCGYTALSQATGNVDLRPKFGPPVTKTAACQVCSPIANNGQSCTALASCLAETPTAIIQVGTSPVPLGTLTAAELSTSLASAISKLCPSSRSACDEAATLTIDHILYVDKGVDQMDNGEVLVHVPASSWSDPSFLPGMIQMAIQSFISSATGSNCKQVSWKHPDHDPGRRSLGNETNWSSLILRKRDPVGGAAPDNSGGTATYCQASNFAGPQYYALDWRNKSPGPAAFLDVELGFRIAPTLADEMLCGFINDILEGLELPIDAEAMGPLQIADGDIMAACEESFAMYNKLNGNQQKLYKAKSTKG